MAHTNLVFTPPFATNFSFPKKSPSISAQVQTPKSKRGEIRYTAQLYPIWSWDWQVNFVRGGEQVANSDYQYLVGFFINMGGMLGDFLLLDPYDNQVTDCFFGVGDGATTQFQLTRTVGLGTDIVQNVNGSITVKKNGSPTSAFTLGTTGIVSFSSAPASGAILTWSGSYYYRVRFDSDAADFEQFMDQIWSMGSLKLKSVIL